MSIVAVRTPAHSLHILLNMVNRVFNRTHQTTSIARAAMDMSMTEICRGFNLLEQVLDVVHYRVEFSQVAFQVPQVA